VKPSPDLPALIDRKTLAAETGLTRAAVDAVFRAVPVVVLPGCRKVFARREDVRRLLEESTFTGAMVRPSAGRRGLSPHHHAGDG
jgi:hypothetical protein